MGQGGLTVGGGQCKSNLTDISMRLYYGTVAYV